MSDSIYVASGFFDRALGMLIPRSSDAILVLIPCKSIHTFFVKRNLDIAFISKEGLVLFSERNVRPGRLIKQKGALCVFERCSDIQKSWFETGQYIGLSVR
ncbi:MAG: hypothetical protein ACI4BI_02925 [Anaerotardibacter sp.]